MNIGIKIVLASLLGTAADHITTKIGLKYPELYEANPRVNFKNEFFMAAIGGLGIYGLAKLLNQSKEVSTVLALVPSAAPFVAAINNTIHIIYAHRREYPWEECPFLYLE